MPSALSWYLCTHPLCRQQPQRLWVACGWAPLSVTELGVSEGLNWAGVSKLPPGLGAQVLQPYWCMARLGAARRLGSISLPPSRWGHLQLCRQPFRGWSESC